MGFYSSIRKNEINEYAGKWMVQACMILNRGNQARKSIATYSLIGGSLDMRTWT